MKVIEPEEIITTISNLKTGEVYKTEEEWKAKGIDEKEIRRDIKLIMPSLDLFGKTKQYNKPKEIRQYYGNNRYTNFRRIRNRSAFY